MKNRDNIPLKLPPLFLNKKEIKSLEFNLMKALIEMNI